MINYLVKISYDGTNYHGWQIQDNAVTVQEVFQNALNKLFCQTIDIKGCSRTDSKVHANEYCISFITDKELSDDNVINGLNTFLPDDVVAFYSTKVNDDFHARYNVKSKEYIYKIYNGNVRNPFFRNYSFYYRYKLDEALLNKAAKEFIGTYDFSGFSSSKIDVENTIRTIYSFDVYREGDFVIFKVCGDGFLYNMVRILVGTLIFVNEGKIELFDIKDIINSKDRKRAGKTAPPQGLYLNKVIY